MEENKTENFFIDLAVALIVIVLLVGFLGAVASTLFGKYVGFIDWLHSRNWSLVRTLIIVFFNILNVAMIAVLVHVFRGIARISRMQLMPDGDITAHPVDLSEEIRGNWQDIKRLAASLNPSDWSMAIIRADALLDDVLQHKGFEGNEMSERLNIAGPGSIPSLERVWTAHRMRNAIAHNPMQQYSRETVFHALESYEMAFRELGLVASPARPAQPVELAGIPPLEPLSPPEPPSPPVIKKAPPPPEFRGPPHPPELPQ